MESKPESWMLLADVHIDGKTHIDETLDWLSSEHDRLKPSHVFLLGDSTHCRKGDMDALSKLKKFVDRLASQGGQVHLLVGNHDMPNLHDRKISSVSLVAQESAGIHVYPEIKDCAISGVPVVFIPWHEDASPLVSKMKEFAARENASSTVVLGHLALQGAQVSGHSHGSSGRVIHDDNAHLSAKDFEGFRQTFLGHYHDPASYGKATYVGSPMQQNFGDAHITERGYIKYDPRTADWSLVVNPHAVHFVSAPCEKVLSGEISPDQLAGKCVKLVTNQQTTLEEEERARRKLYEDCRARDVKVPPRRMEGLSEVKSDGDASGDKPVEDPREFLMKMVDQFVEESVQETSLHQSMKEYMSRMVEALVEKSSQTVFHADIAELQIENFLGIPGTKVFAFDQLPRGIWMVQGPNGAGKSQLIDAIAFVLFSETFRGVNREEILNVNHTSDGTPKKNSQKDTHNRKRPTSAKTKSQCAVQVRFKNGITIRRTLKPSLRITMPGGSIVEKGSVSETQRYLEKEVLNTDWDTFRRTVLLDFGDFLALFTKDDKQRSQVMETLLGMGVLDTMHQRVDQDFKETLEKARSIADQAQQLEANVRRLEEGLQMASQAAQTGAGSLSTLETDTARLQSEDEAVRDEIAIHEASIERQKSIMDDTMAQLTTARNALAEADKELARLNAELTSKRQQRAKLESELSLLREREVNLRNQYTAFDSAKNDLLENNGPGADEQASLQSELSASQKHLESLRGDQQSVDRELKDTLSGMADHGSETKRGLSLLTREEDEAIENLSREEQELNRQRVAAQKHRKQSIKDRKGNLKSAGEDLMRLVSSHKEISEKLHVIQEKQTEAFRLESSIRNQKERLNLPRIIEKAIEHGNASQNPDVIDGIRRDVVDPLLEMFPRGQVDLSGILEADMATLKVLERDIEILTQDPVHGTLTTSLLNSKLTQMQSAEHSRDRAVENAETAEKNEEDKATDLESRITSVGEGLTLARDTRNQKRSLYELKREAQLKELSQQSKALREQSDAAHRKVDEAQDLHADLVHRLKDIRKNEAQHAARVAQADRELSKCRYELEACVESLKKQQSHFDALEDLEYPSILVNEKRAEVEKHRQEVHGLQNEYSDAETIHREADRLLKDLQNRRVSLATACAEASLKLQQAQASLDQTDRDIKRLESELETEKSALQEVRGSSRDIHQQMLVRSHWKEALANTNDPGQHSKASSQRGGFRKKCRATHLNFLNDRVTENMYTLQGNTRNPHMSCRLSEAFQVMPTNDRSAQWAQRSSGERKRTVMAFIFAVLESMMTYGSFRPSFLILDEVHDNLDVEGRRSVHRLLMDFKHRNPQHRVFVISHGESEDHQMDGTITVTPNGLYTDRTYIARDKTGSIIDKFITSQQP